MKDEIKKALEEATIGPWAVVKLMNGKTYEVWQNTDNSTIARVASPNPEADAHLIANSLTWLEWAVGRIDQLEKAVRIAHNIVELIRLELADVLEKEKTAEAE